MSSQRLTIITNGKKLKNHLPAGILCVPAALSLGVALARPAAAQTVISASQSATVNLGSYGGVKDFSITSTASISASSGFGVYGDATGPWSLTNAGDISAPAAIGIFLKSAGDIINTGAIDGDNAAIRLNAGGSILNEGALSGTRYGLLANGTAASVSNDGIITAQYDGISLNHGGQVVNNAGGTIFGNHIGIYTGKSLGFVENSGLVASSTGDAVSIYNGGTFTNEAAGVLHGGYSGVYAGGNHALVQNAGLIQGASFGVYLDGASSLTNTGTIQGTQIGVVEVAAGGSLTNGGLITATSVGLEMYRPGAVDNSGTISGGTTGVFLPHGGAVTNEAGAVITGGSFGITGTGLTLVSDGTIAAPTAIQLSGTLPSYLTFGTGSSVQGNIDAGGTDSFMTLTGNGTFTADLDNFGPASALTIADGANWAASGNWAVGNVTNNGTLEPGIPGTSLNITGNFTQTSTGTLLVLITPTATTQFNVSGTAQLAGQVVYDFAPGTYTPHAVTFLTAAGGTTGAFDTVSYAGVLTPAPSAQTPAPAAAVVVPVAVTPVVTPSATPAVTPAATPSQPVAVQRVAAVAQLAVTQSFTVAPAGASLFGSAAQAVADSSASLDDATLRHAGTDGSWAEAVTSRLNASDHANTSGLVTGLGGSIGTLHAGVTVGYGQTSLSATAGTATTQATRIGLYAEQPIGAVLLSGLLTETFAGNSTHRNTGAGTATGRYQGHILSGTLQAALPFTYDNLSLTPATGLRISSITTGHFQEHAAQAAFALRGSGASFTAVQPYMSVQLSRRFMTARQISIMPLARLGYTLNAGESRFTQSLQAADGTLFTASAARRSPAGALQAGAGLAAGRGNWQIFARYGMSLAGGTASQTAEAGFSISF